MQFGACFAVTKTPITGRISTASWLFGLPAPSISKKPTGILSTPPSPQKLTLELGEPEIQGNFASIKGKETHSGALSASGPFTATLVRQGDKWVIQSGIF